MLYDYLKEQRQSCYELNMRDIALKCVGRKNMETKEILQILCEKHGISKNEYDVANAVKDLIAPFCDEVYIDDLANVIALKKGISQTKKKIMLDAHIDEIGLMVSEIDEKGFIHISPVGGVDVKSLPSSEVTVFGKKEIWGVIGTKPPHIQTASESEKPFSFEDLTVDTGYEKEELEKIVSVGDYISVRGEFLSLSDHRCTSKSIDNRAGACAVINAAKELYNQNVQDDIYYVFSTCEEVNMSGAKYVSNKIKPDIALVIDVTHGITEDNFESAYALGKGPSYSIGPNITKCCCKLVEKTANKENIPIHPEVDGASSGTNAWKIQTASEGIGIAVVSIPLRYMHTAVEIVDIRDIDSAAKIASEFAKEAGRLCV